MYGGWIGNHTPTIFPSQRPALSAQNFPTPPPLAEIERHSPARNAAIVATHDGALYQLVSCKLENGLEPFELWRAKIDTFGRASLAVR